MLQIITGKFYDREERFHNDCKGILYSNVGMYGQQEIGHTKLESVESGNNISSYVFSYDNQMQVMPGGFSPVKVGDHEIVRQYKNILSFCFDCVFDEDKGTVEKVCKQTGNGTGKSSVPSEYICHTLNLKRSLSNEELIKGKQLLII